MKYPKKIQDLMKSAMTWKGMRRTQPADEYKRVSPIAESLVKERIQGNRKAMENDPNFMHSFRVSEIVQKLHHWDDPDYELFLAALLHDIVEDGNVSFEELVEMGFSDRTVELIYLCTHDKQIQNHTERWVRMIAKLIEANDVDAWSIKIADLADNLTQSDGLTEENRKFMIEAKAPVVLRLTEQLGKGYLYRYFAYLRDTLEAVKKRNRELIGQVD